MAEYVTANTSFSCSLDGVTPYSVHEGDVFAADDPVVTQEPGSFEPLYVRDSREVRRPLHARPYPGAQRETATAAPGERRTVVTAPPAPPAGAPVAAGSKAAQGGGKAKAGAPAKASAGATATVTSDSEV